MIARQTRGGGYRAYVLIELYQVSVTAGIAAHLRPVAFFVTRALMPGYTVHTGTVAEVRDACGVHDLILGCGMAAPITAYGQQTS